MLAAPLVLTFLCFIELPDAEAFASRALDNPLFFLISYLVAAALTCCTFVCIPALRQRGFLRIPALACALPAIVGIGLAFSNSATGFGIALQLPLGAALVGIGSALLLLMWTQAYAALDARELVPAVAATFAVAFIFKLLFSFVATSPLNLAILGAALIVSALPLDTKALAPRDDDRPIGSSSTSVTSLFLLWWKPLLGCVLCCMIWGFSWGNSIVGSPPDGAGGTGGIILTDVGKLAASILVFVVGTRRRSDIGSGFWMPSAVGLLLLGWILAMLGSTGGSALASISSGVGFALFEIALWIKTCEMSASSPARARILFALSHALLAGVVLLGIAAAPLLGPVGGELITPVCSVIFFVLLAALPSTGTRKSHEHPALDGANPEATLEAAVETIRTEYGLSPRETEVFSMFVRGHSANYIAEQLVVSLHTVKTHVKRIYEKLDVHSKDELIAFFDHHRAPRN